MLTELSRRDWQHYFDRVSAALAGRAAQADTTGLGLDAEVPGDWIGLVSLTYDVQRDELVLMLEGARRLARRPVRIHVHQDEGWLHGIELADAEGRRDFVLLRRPLQVLGIT